MAKTTTLPRTARDSLADYGPALREACEQAGGVDPVLVLTDTDQYPQVTEGIPMAEFLVGWFHGLADAMGLQVEAVWDLVPEPAKPKAKRKAKAKAKPEPEPEPTPEPTPEPPKAKAKPAPKAKAKPKAPAKAPKAKPAPKAKAAPKAKPAPKADAAKKADAKAALAKLQAKREPAKAGARVQVTFDQLVAALDAGRAPTKPIEVHADGPTQVALVAGLATIHGLDAIAIDRKAA